MTKPAKKADLAVYIGRFQPFHIGHAHAVQKAFEHADNVLILIGSAYGPRTIKNPWTFSERAYMIQLGLPYEAFKHVSIRPLRDYIYDDVLWAKQVQEIVESEVDEGDTVILAGHAKDESSYYLKIFPQWKMVDSGYLDLLGSKHLDATKIRELYFQNQRPYIASVVNPRVLQYMLDVESMEPGVRALQEEYDFIQSYKKSWAAAPYPPTFVTVDAVVVQSGHVLLVRRGAAPGRGLWAVPGGFVDPKEKLEAAALRELKEETCIKLQTSVLQRCISEREIFDAPDRSERGRTVTTAYFIELDDSQPLPKVNGADDADKAHWFTFAEFAEMQDQMYEDHWHIVNHFLKLTAG